MKKIELDLNEFIQLTILASTTEILLKMNSDKDLNIAKGGLIKAVINTKKEIDSKVNNSLYDIMPKKYF